MSQPTDHAVPCEAFGPAPAAPPVRTVGRFHDLAQQQRLVRIESLAYRDKSELVQAREGRQVRGREGSVKHVEVFPMRCVGTLIFGRPRHLPGRDALTTTRLPARTPGTTTYTINCEEPLWCFYTPIRPLRCESSRLVARRCDPYADEPPDTSPVCGSKVSRSFSAATAIATGATSVECDPEIVTTTHSFVT